MTLTKSHLIDAIVAQNGFTHTKSTETVENILEIIMAFELPAFLAAVAVRKLDIQ